MADRYTYIASIGYSLLFAYIFFHIYERARKRGRNILILILLIYIAFLGVSTFNRTKIWKDSMTLWNDVIEKYKNVFKAWNNRGVIKRANGDYKGAIYDFNQAI